MAAGAEAEPARHAVGHTFALAEGVKTSQEPRHHGAAQNATFTLQF